MKVSKPDLVMLRSTSFRLDPITQQMCPVIASLHAICFDDAWTATVLNKLIITPGVFGYIIHVNSAVRGFIICRSIGTEGEILSLAVAPGVRRKGLGLSLINTVKSHAMKNDLNALIIEVAEDNFPAKYLYSKTGFSEVGQRYNYYRRKNGLNVNAYILKCDLTQDNELDPCKR